MNLGIWKSRPGVTPHHIVSCMAEKARLKELCDEGEAFTNFLMPEVAELRLFVAPESWKGTES